MRLAAARAAVALATALMLGGCVNPPSDGPVVPGGPGPAVETDEPFVRPIANPPRPGMTQTEIVSGYLNAVAAVGDNYRTARAYLTPEAALSWDPGAGVEVMEEDAPALTAAGDSVAAEYRRIGAVQSDGVLDEQPPTAASSSFGMASQDGEWRIAAPPQGLLLSRADLASAFQVRSAYFIDPTGTYAVPDVRIVPLTGPQALATALVTALLAGPSDWLRPAVSTVIPEGLTLAIGAVPVSGGVAVVELSGPEFPLDETGADLFGVQFAWTLRQVPGVVGMQITVNGKPVPLSERHGSVPLDRFDRSNPDVIVAHASLYGVTPDGEPAVMEEDQVVALPGAGDATVAAIAAAPVGALVVAASRQRDQVLLGDPDSPDPPQVVPGAVAAGPRMDARERIWWTDPQGRVRVAADRDGSGVWTPAPVEVVGAPGPVAVVAPSRDGTRAALLVRGPGGATVLIGVIVDDELGTRIIGARPLGDRASATDIAWHDADEVTVLDADGGAIVRFDLLGGTTAALSAPAGATSVADAPHDPVVVGLSDGSSGLITGMGLRTMAGLGAPAYPG